MKKHPWIESPEVLQERQDLLKFIPDDTRKLLDVGCSCGDFGGFFKFQNKASFVAGVEKNPDFAEIAKKKLNLVIQGDIEQITLDFEDEYFDCIVYADILEHLKNPLELLQKHRRMLKNNGTVIASIPNVGHYSALLQLLKQRWDYKEEGIMDKTHLRFFTRASILELFERSGFQQIKIFRKLPPSLKEKLFCFFTFNILKDFFISGFIVSAKKFKA